MRSPTRYPRADWSERGAEDEDPETDGCWRRLTGAVALLVYPYAHAWYAWSLVPPDEQAVRPDAPKTGFHVPRSQLRWAHRLPCSRSMAREIWRGQRHICHIGRPRLHHDELPRGPGRPSRPSWRGSLASLARCALQARPRARPGCRSTRTNSAASPGPKHRSSSLRSEVQVFCFLIRLFAPVGLRSGGSPSRIASRPLGISV